MVRRRDDFARYYWRKQVQAAGCMALIGLVLVLAALAIGWLIRH